VSSDRTKELDGETISKKLQGRYFSLVVFPPEAAIVINGKTPNYSRRCGARDRERAFHAPGQIPGPLTSVNADSVRKADSEFVSYEGRLATAFALTLERRLKSEC